MSAFVGVVGANCRADEDLLRALSRAIASFGERAIPSDVSVDFQVVRASSSLEIEPFVVEEDGVVAVGNVRWTARGDLAHELGAPADIAEGLLLLLAYRRWGTDLLLHVQGEFAFILCDQAEHLVLAATDHFAVRPLFYARQAQRLLLSDSAPALRDSGLCDVTLNENSIGDFLALGFITDERATCYQGIERLAPATRLICANGDLQVDTYWQTPAQEQLLLLPRIEDYAEELRDILMRAVAERLPSSGEVGVMLSGGMDSTSITACLCHALARDGAGERVTAFTYVSRTVREQEGHYSALVTKHLGIRHRVFVLEDAMEQSLRQPMAVCPPQPSLEPPSLATSLPGLEMAARGGKLFSGHGSDDVFRPSRRDLQRIAARGWWQLPRHFVRYWAVTGGPPALGARRSLSRKLGRKGENILPLWIHPHFAKRTGLQERLSAYLADQADAGRALRGPFWTNMVSLGVSSLTAAPFDASYPYFDIRLLRYASRLPDSVVAQKRILREAMRSLLPDAVLQRPKTLMGSAGVQIQIDPHQQQRRGALLNEAGSSIEGIVNLNVLRRSIASPQAESSPGLERVELLLRWVSRSI